MRHFDFYEFTGILLPGALLIAGVVFLWPEASKVDGFKDLSMGGVGIVVLLAYVTGHLVQAVGNWIEWVWWKAFGGLPSDWIRSGTGRLLAPDQMRILRTSIENRLSLKLPEELSELRASAWYAITRQIYAAVDAAGRAARIDRFNGNYGLNRGLLSAALLVACLSLASSKGSMVMTVAIMIIAALAGVRMHRFAKHYGQELFVQFIQLPPSTEPKVKNAVTSQ